MSVSKTDLAKIHIAKSQLGMSDDVYRDMLQRVAGVRSAKDIPATRLAGVFAELKRLGFKPSSKAGRAVNSVASGNKALMSKINALLANAGRPMAYADAMAKRMFGVDRVEWCGQENLRKIVAALTYDQRRHS